MGKDHIVHGFSRVRLVREKYFTGKIRLCQLLMRHIKEKYFYGERPNCTFSIIHMRNESKLLIYVLAGIMISRCSQ